MDVLTKVCSKLKIDMCICIYNFLHVGEWNIRLKKIRKFKDLKKEIKKLHVLAIVR